MVAGVFLMKKDNFYERFKSSIPKHLTPEERKEWEKNAEWEKKEYERRKKDGLYDTGEDENIVSKIVRRFKFKSKDADDTWYGN